MSWTRTLLITTAVALAFVACSENVSSPATADQERTQLVERALSLKASVLESGGITPELRRKIDHLQQDIETWQTRTGRDDLSVSRPEPGMTAAVQASEAKGSGPSSAPCLPCPPVTADATQICYLVEGGPCPTGSPGEIGLHVCAYLCIKVAGGIAPARR